jgi:hypothetical protein
MYNPILIYFLAIATAQVKVIKKSKAIPVTGRENL